jgi:hypothetical protein
MKPPNLYTSTLGKWEFVYLPRHNELTRNDIYILCKFVSSEGKCINDITQRMNLYITTTENNYHAGPPCDCVCLAVNSASRAAVKLSLMVLNWVCIDFH